VAQLLGAMGAPAPRDDRNVLARPDPPSGSGAPESRPLRRGRRMLSVLGAIVLTVLGLIAGTVLTLAERLAADVERVPGVFASLDPATRPSAADALTFVVVPTDSRPPLPSAGTEEPTASDIGDEPIEVVMIMQVAADGSAASVVSIPFATRLDVPGQGVATLETAYALGGASSLVRALENLTALRIDHFIEVDFAGLPAMVDAIGGIDLPVADPRSRSDTPARRGFRRVDGAQALAFARERRGPPDGRIDRAPRQQVALRAFVHAMTQEALVDPPALYRLLAATSRAVRVDDTLSTTAMGVLAVELSGLRSSQVTYLTVPVVRADPDRSRPAEYLVDPRAAELWTAMRADTVLPYLARHPEDRMRWRAR
jgi:LCP family protein required for cell wall assembly